MKWGVSLSMVLMLGCLPPIQQTLMSRKIQALTVERDVARDELAECREKIKKLESKILSKTLQPTQTKINSAELEQIKKQAFEEAERKYKDRVEKGNSKK